MLPMTVLAAIAHAKIELLVGILVSATAVFTNIAGLPKVLSH